ncbi:ice-binding family protein [Flavobacterium sp. SM2513]|uniref:ice-binding family protein n=1 Tax=Flavobacterium sp. SM2513 TaxID=3424766 RepID=UPI003D7F6FAC
MKNILTCCLLPFMLLTATTLSAQVGIGITEPDASAMLDVASESKGLLMPRLSSTQRDAITLPANGLMIYNTDLNDGQLNIGTPAVPNWIGIKGQEGPVPTIASISEGDEVSTSSEVFELIPAMTVSPPTGAYLVLFNAQISSSKTFSSTQGVTDVNAIYSNLMSATGGVSHTLVFGSGETLLPGVYDVTGAPSIAGSLILDGGGNPDALFIIRGTGAFTTGSGTVVSLTNGANANNVFWVSEGAMSTGAPTTMKGTLIAHDAAVALGANTDLEGRMMSTIGALTMGAGSVLTAPSGSSIFDLGVLSSFVMFTASGGVSGCPTCSVTGDVGTGAGAATSFSTIDGNIYPAGTTSIPSSSSYCVFKNGAEVLNSSRRIDSPSSMVFLQSKIDTTEGDIIEIRWKVDEGQAIIENRTFTIIRSN